MREFVEDRHGGLEVAPESNLEVAPESTLEVAPESSLEPVAPHSAPEVAPESALEVGEPPIFSSKSIPSPTAIELPLKEISDDPIQDAKPKRARWSTRTWLAVGAIAILLLLVVGLGAGLGIASKHKSSRGSASAPVQSSQSTSSSSSSPSSLSSGTPVSTALTGAISPTGVSTVSSQAFLLNDQLSTNKTSQWWYFGQTKTQIDQLCTKNNARITQIRVDNATIPTFTVLMIDNTGIYKSDWWWYAGANSTSQGTDRRFISIDPYLDSQGVLQFAAVQVPNTGNQDKGWWWYFGQSSGAINGLLQQYNARLVSLRGYTALGSTYYAIIMTENADPDYAVSEWHTGISIADISARVAAGQRLISLSPNPSGNWDTILVQNPGQKWGWWYDLGTQGVGPTSMLNNFRIVDISPYRVNGNLLFATVETDNSG